MKTARTIMSALFLIFIISSITLAQAGSVELKDGGGVLISSHASVQEAYNAIPVPVTQAYLIEILNTYTAATEVYPITFGLKTGTSASNTITFRPAAGVTGKIITALATGTPIILLDDADYTIIDGRPGGVGDDPDLTLENTATTNTNSYTIRFLNGATNNIVQYCVIKNNTQSTAGPRAIEVGTSISNPTGNSDNIIQYNEIIGGRSGIGFAGTTANPNQNNRVMNNSISDFGYSGIWVLSSTHNTRITGNSIFQRFGFNTANFGIIAGGFINLDIIGNMIFDIQNTASTTLRGMQLTPAAGSVLNVVNNFVSLTLDNGTKTTYYGINILGSTENTTNILYNTVRIGGTHTGGTAGSVLSGGIVKGSTGATATYNQKNNIVLNTRTGGAAGGFHTGYFSTATANVGTQDIDYNVYYGIDSTSLHAGWGGTLYSDLAQYKAAAAPNEQNTIFKPVNFVSETDLHLTGASVGDFDLAGIPTPGIVDDIDGDLRHLTYPYRGADEADIPLPVELVNFTANVVGSTVTLSWFTATEVNNFGFEIERKTKSTTWIKVGFVPGYGTTAEVKNYSYADNNVMTGIYNYRIKQIDHNGTFTYYQLSESVEIGAPVVFELAQNYPNPFNPLTNIKYSIATESSVKLIVFNSIGQEVAQLVNETQQPGNYSLGFNAVALSSGVYFYKLIAGDFVATKKMLLVK